MRVRGQRRLRPPHGGDPVLQYFLVVLGTYGLVGGPRNKPLRLTTCGLRQPAVVFLGELTASMAFRPFGGHSRHGATVGYQRTAPVTPG